MLNLKKDFIFDDLMVKNFINTSTEEKEIVRNCRNHVSVREWMYSDNIISSEEHIYFIKNLKNDNNNFYWIVQKGQECIGVISLNKIDLRNKNAYLGIYSNPYCKLKTKGNLLIKCLKTLAFDIAKLHTLKLEVVDNNKRAISFYKKSGFKEEGRLKEFVFKNGNWYDMIVMGITKGKT
ncbi:UDP-4-amino-4,6-dideoxy-N-acetyl-beta-L-altrosamine N-acetyltransferase [Methanococcoides methylutens]|uniref:UDP-4-amino-4, 6-dideoxy-N-acetyl-beta-L-altrosamine N-acetyltransferase n=1 Tax=Methanococcoides methylutens TaxID=2226 RepID=UPI00404456A6